MQAKYRVVVAPKASGETSSIAWKNAATAGPTDTQTLVEGRASTYAMAAAGTSTVYPMAWWARGLSIGVYPTEQPEFFGTCHDESAIDVPGVLAQMTQAEWEALRADEMLARNPVPATVTRAQGKAALIQAGLWSGVLAYVAGIDDETQRALAEVALHDTTLWQRSSPFLTAAAHALGMNDDALDALFVAAAGVEL
ncbi:hypothetical protein [Acidovorax facilis]|uniref:hypothetical protein n=1 Tax=Acidovorax facilis TaxID=12917 RepID=UPI003D64ADE0